MTHASPNRRELQEMLGRNLRLLMADKPSVSAVCREIGINRTQFNRYLSGEATPRPWILKQICDYFGTDARILLEPVERPRPPADAAPPAPQLFARVLRELPAEDSQVRGEFAEGFYVLWKYTHSWADRFQSILGQFQRTDGGMLMRGLAPTRGVRAIPRDTPYRDRQVHGLFMGQQALRAVMFDTFSRTPYFARFDYPAGVYHRHFPGTISAAWGPDQFYRITAPAVLVKLSDSAADVLKTARAARLRVRADEVPEDICEILHAIKERHHLP